ncbi:MAG: peptidase S16, partial [Meiothermus sp.]|nr:peptidase S16 [Meiothermus sp.]
KVLAVGAINAKVEGFFRVCQALGLSGSQGVILPRANLPNLTLRAEVLEAIRAHRFHIYAVETVEQALELLSGARMEGFRGLQDRIKAGLEEFAKLEEGHDREEKET